MRLIIIFLFITNISFAKYTGGCIPYNAEVARGHAVRGMKVNDFDHIFKAHGSKENVPSLIIKAVCLQESAGKIKALGKDPGGTHGYGLMQLTFPQLGLEKFIKKYFHNINNRNQLWNPALNIAVGTKWLKSKPGYKKFMQNKNAPNFLYWIQNYNSGNCQKSQGYARMVLDIYGILSKNSNSSLFPMPQYEELYPINGEDCTPTPYSSNDDFKSPIDNNVPNDNSIPNQIGRKLQDATSPFLKMPWDLNPF